MTNLVMHNSLSIVLALMWLGDHENQCVHLHKTYLFVQTIYVQNHESGSVVSPRFKIRILSLDETLSYSFIYIYMYIPFPTMVNSMILFVI